MKRKDIEEIEYLKQKVESSKYRILKKIKKVVSTEVWFFSFEEAE